MAKPAVRIRVVEFTILLGPLAVVVRSAQVQLFQGRRWRSEAQAQRTERLTLEARRGALYDRHGTALALTQETYHVGLAPNELRDPRRDAAALSRALRLSPAALDAALRKRYAWFRGPFSALDVQPIRELHGVHLETVPNRFYPAPEFARAVIGRVGDDGHGASGMERLFDSLLAGTPGAAVVLKDRAGREYESPARVIADPVAGADIVLTLDAELQEIAQRALSDALRQMDAEGGDVLMLDPRSGEVLAVASRRRDGSAPPSAFAETFEPGSLAKIFAAAALLSLDRVRPTEHVSGEGGKYKLPDRTLVDDHPLPSLTLADAIRVSSNIAMAKFSTRLAPREQYAVLRDFGIGAPEGDRVPAGVAGPAALPSRLVRHQPGESRDRLRDGGHAAADRHGVCRHRQRRRAAATDAGAGDARPGRHGAVSTYGGTGASGGASGSRTAAARAAPRGGRRRNWRRGDPRELPARRQNRHRPPRGGRALCPRGIHRVLRRPLSRRRSTARGRGENRQSA